MRRMSMNRLALGVLLLSSLCASPRLAGLARADDWQVTRSPFDPRVVAGLKAELQRHPDDSRALQRLVGLYKSYKSLAALAQELTAQAERSHAQVDYLLAGHAQRVRGQLDEAQKLYQQAAAAARPEHAGIAGAAALGQAEVALLRKPADLEEAQRQLGVALSGLPKEDSRRGAALRKAAEVALLRGDVDRARAVYAELLQRAKPEEQEPLRRDLIAALVAAGRHKEALGEWQALLPRLGEGAQKAEAHLRMGELLFTLKDDAGASAAYQQGLKLLPRGHHLRFDFYEHLIELHRRREDLGGLLGQLEKDWPAAGRTFLEWQTLARLYDEHGAVAQAVEAYRSALSREPHNLDARRRLIAVLERSGAPPEQAIKEYERLCTEAPGEGRYHLELAERLEKSGQRARALEVLRRAAARLSADPSLHSALSDLYQRWGEAELALKEAEILCRIEPRDEGHIINLGELYWSRGRKDKADEVWRRLLTLEPRAALMQARLADVYAEHNLMGEAIDLYQRALKAEPQSQPLKRGLALAYERMNRPRDAVPLWEQVYFSQPGPPLSLEARHHLATLCSKEARLRSHFHAWRQRFHDLIDARIAPQPELLSLGLLLAETSLNLGGAQEAEVTLRRLADVLKDPRLRGEVLLGLVPVYRQQHRLPEAIAALKEAVALLPERARELYGQLADLALQTYRDDEAVAYAEKAGNDAQGELRLAELFERKDDMPRAQAAYKRAVALDDRLFRAYMGLGRLHLRAGELTEAAAVYREVARRAPQEELVLEAGRKAIDLYEYLGNLGELYRDLLPLVHAYQQKPAYRRLLLTLYERYALPLIEPARRGDAEAQAELQRLGQSGLKPLTEALLDGDLGEQRTAVALLGELRNPGAAAPLLRVALGPQREAGPRPAAEGRGKGAGAVAVIATLKAGAGQADMDLRVGALLAAARLGDAHSLPVFAQLLQSSEKSLRAAALYGVLVLVHAGTVPGKGEIALLERALRDPGADVRGLACLALSRLHRPPGLLLPLLAAGARDGNSAAATEACVHAVGALRDSAAVPALIDVLRDGDDDLAQQAAWALGQSADRRAIAPLLRAVFLRSEPVRLAAATALRGGVGEAPLPAPELEAEGVDVRRLVAKLSAGPALPAREVPLWATPSEGPALLAAVEEALLGHHDVVVRALLDLSGAPGAGSSGERLPLLLGPLTQGLGAAELDRVRPLLTYLGQRLVPRLKQLALEAPEQTALPLRQSAVELLGRLADVTGVREDVAETLAQAAQADPAVEVRLAAVQGLLSSHADARGREILARMAQSPDWRLRLGAVQRAPQSSPLRARAQSDPDGYVREAGRPSARPPGP